jgi:hypothetical protein
MSRKLVTVRKIGDLLPIEGADLIELAVVDGWKCVVRKGEFAIGDFAVYFEIDSFLPSTDSRFESFMKSSREYLGVVGHKLRTIKLRGQISQGLAMPIKLFPEIMNSFTVPWDKVPPTAGDEIDFNTITSFELAVKASIARELNKIPEQYEGIDFAEKIGIVKWEPPVSGAVQGQVAGSFPSFIRKTDQERHQNIKSEIFGYDATYVDFDISTIPREAVEKLMKEGKVGFINGVCKKLIPAKASPDARYEVTLKLDGTSCTYFKRDEDVGVCSRNLQLKINEENIASNALVNIFVNSGLQRILENASKELAPNLAIQGEVMGPGIQGNRENFKHPTFYIFDIFNIDTGEYLTPAERADAYDELIERGANPELVKHVPIIAISTLQDLGIVDTESLIKYAEGPSINHKIREGVVFKRLDGKFSFKSISNTFLAKEQD